ncbi:MAG: hypothetical protein LAP86_11280 [Acidobacteriia bacterium]|nr:hypothetical protein [Terriglobia bacterium]
MSDAGLVSQNESKNKQKKNVTQGNKKKITSQKGAMVSNNLTKGAFNE